MLSRILVPMEGSEMAEQVLEYALENHPNAEITVLTVVGEPLMMMGEAVGLALKNDLEAAARGRAKEVHDRARELAAEYDTEIDTVVDLGQPAWSIINHAENYDAIVIGSHGGDVFDWFFVGNVAEAVFRHSPVPVIAVR
ncbi:universal stress protein [Natronococcus wangiae]|uniref:universal stress protein n=1 Tax=Natronococcus wangiae TaxID=3068275 RepID=UPI00273DF177|nr:universal stress protein [Natronococcus sp. AD5]